MKNGDYILVKAPTNYPGKKYRNKYCYEHHLVYWQHYGIIPNNNPYSKEYLSKKVKKYIDKYPLNKASAKNFIKYIILICFTTAVCH